MPPAAPRFSAGWRLIGGLVRMQRRVLLLGTAGGVLWQAAGALAPLVVARIVDDGLIGRDRSALWTWSAVLVGLCLVEAWSSRTRHKYAVSLFARTGAVLRQRLLERAQRLDATFHDATPAGTLLARATSDVERVSVVLDHIPHTTGFAMAVVVVTGLLATVDAVVATVVVGTLALLAVVTVVGARPQHRRATALQQEISNATVVAEEILVGYTVIKGLGAEPAQAERVEAAAGAVRGRGIEANRVDAAVEALVEVLPALTLAAALWVGGHRVADGELTVGRLLAALTYVTFLVWPMRILGERVGTAQKGHASASRLTAVFDAETRVPEPERPRPLPPRGALAVEVEGVSFGYGDGPAVIDGVTLPVAAGSRVAVVGATGSGKSTLLALVAREYDVRSGAVRVGGVDVRDVAQGELGAALALAGHDPVLFAGTVAANIAFARPSATRAEVEAAARVVAADEFVRRLPDGYDTVVGERGMTLSGGQRQRIALARAIVARPRLLLLDDATSALDAATEARVVAGLTAERRDATVVLVTHRPATLRLADEVVLLDGGRVAARGRHEELLARDERYREVLAHVHAERDLLDAAPESAEPAEEVTAP